MKLLREGTHRKFGKIILFNDQKPTILVGLNELKLQSFNNSDPQSESTYDYTIEL